MYKEKMIQIVIFRNFTVIYDLPYGKVQMI